MTGVPRRFCLDCPGNSAGRHRACPSGMLDDPCQSCSFCCLRAHLVACRRDSTDFMRHSYLDDPPSATSCARKDSAGCCAAPSPRPASARPPPAVTHALPAAAVIDFATLPERTHTTMAELLLTVPDLVALDLPGLVKRAGYPGTKTI